MEYHISCPIYNILPLTLYTVDLGKKGEEATPVGINSKSDTNQNHGFKNANITCLDILRSLTKWSCRANHKAWPSSCQLSKHRVSFQVNVTLRFLNRKNKSRRTRLEQYFSHYTTISIIFFRHATQFSQFAPGHVIIGARHANMPEGFNTTRHHQPTLTQARKSTCTGVLLLEGAYSKVKPCFDNTEVKLNPPRHHYPLGFVAAFNNSFTDLSRLSLYAKRYFQRLFLLLLRLSALLTG